jgi:hypothetical protein
MHRARGKLRIPQAGQQAAYPRQAKVHRWT